MTMLILIAEGKHSGEERQTLVCEDDFEGNPEDYFVNAVNARIAGKIECDGDTEHLSGIYDRV